MYYWKDVYLYLYCIHIKIFSHIKTLQDNIPHFKYLQAIYAFNMLLKVIL